jgi:hypothetical protein
MHAFCVVRITCALEIFLFSLMMSSSSAVSDPSPNILALSNWSLTFAHSASSLQNKMTG